MHCQTTASTHLLAQDNLRTSNPNDNVHALGNLAFRQGWQAGNGDFSGIDIDDFTRLNIVKMMVGTGVGIVKHLVRIDDYFPYQAFFHE